MEKSLQSLLKKIERLKGSIDALRPFDDAINVLLQERLRIEWTYNSNAIEGNTLTFGETAFYLREGLTSEGKPLKDYLEARNHAEAIDGLHEIIQNERPITEGLIKELHGVLMQGMEFTMAKGADGRMIKKPLNVGKYKIRPNYVLTSTGKIHHYADPLKVKDEMEQLVKWLHSKETAHPIEKAAIFHYKFVAIHPFDDGNGRLARLLMNLILMKDGYMPCIIKNSHRRQYLNRLNEMDKSGKYDGFVKFVAEELFGSMEIAANILNGKETKEDYGETKLNRDERDALILEVVEKKPLSIGQIESIVSAIKRPTLKSDLKRLVRGGQIKQKGFKKGVVYFTL